MSISVLPAREANKSPTKSEISVNQGSRESREEVGHFHIASLIANKPLFKAGGLRDFSHVWEIIRRYTLIENDHLGDYSPEKDCCWRLTFR